MITQYLEPSLKKWNLNYYIEGLKDMGTWHLNTDLKATFIYKSLKKFEEDIVFIDADAEIKRYPQLLFNIPKKYDIAAHFLDWHLQWRGQRGKDEFEFLSGTMMFRYNQKVLRMCERYIGECRREVFKVEQKVLQGILEKSEDIEIYRLPAEYCTVILHNNKVPHYIKDPVIVHNQVSRKYKNKRS